MELEVLGRHALLFDDDNMAAFVNSSDALLQWNSLFIDRYDVRHLLNQLPPFARRRRVLPPVEPDGVPCSDLDAERYCDLPPGEEDKVDPDSLETTAPLASASYQAVGYSYANVASSNPKNSAAAENTHYNPPFLVPESLQNNLPPNEKLHQIIARTAKFVKEHGAQSEIVLRVKQGDNPVFGFLMPDHHLHPYFRFLVDHSQLLKPDTELKQKDEGKDGGALSLLESVYGGDDDGPEHDASESKEKEARYSSLVTNLVSHNSEKVESHSLLSKKEKADTKTHCSSANAKLSSRQKNSLSSVSLSDKVTKKQDAEAVKLHSVAHRQQLLLLPRTSEVEHKILEPPSSLKHVVDKIVEFVTRNGKESEAILSEDYASKFPFILPHNQYHPYYLKALQKVQEEKLPWRSNVAQENIKGSIGYELKMERHFEGVYDAEKKEKFKMIIGSTRKGSQDSSYRSSERQSGVSADAAAAIVMAATRGLRSPNLDIVHGTSCSGSGAGAFGAVLSGSGSSYKDNIKIVTNGQFPGISSKATSHLNSSTSKTGDVSVAKILAKSAALAAANEADSTEAGLTKEQKQKAERLKRAKMFSAMIKRGADMSSGMISRLSPQPPSFLNPDSWGANGAVSNEAGNKSFDIASRERESSVPVASEQLDDKDKAKDLQDSYEGGRSRRTSSIGSRHDASSDEDIRDSKRHSSRHSLHHRSHRHKHRISHREYRHKHEYYTSSEDEHSHKGRSHKHKRSRDSSFEKGRLQDVQRSYCEGPQRDGSADVPDDLRAKVREMLLATM